MHNKAVYRQYTCMSLNSLPTSIYKVVIVSNTISKVKLGRCDILPSRAMLSFYIL